MMIYFNNLFIHLGILFTNLPLLNLCRFFFILCRETQVAPCRVNLRTVGMWLASPVGVKDALAQDNQVFTPMWLSLQTGFWNKLQKIKTENTRVKLILHATNFMWLCLKTHFILFLHLEKTAKISYLNVYILIYFIRPFQTIEIQMNLRFHFNYYF